jgi:hypothetical protein
MPATTPGSSSNHLLKAVVTSQHHNRSVQAPETSKFASGKIPFAEAPNPPATSRPQQPTFKTPNRAMQGPGQQSTAAKSSPHYPPSEQIQLPDIATDSEDDDENEFTAPSWTDSPALRELLSQQQLVDPQSVFGPIAPLHMEEIFKNKERHKRFRDRTSSANWAGADRLTEDERRRDKEARERLMRDGGWTFNTHS